MNIELRRKMFSIAHEMSNEVIQWEPFIRNHMSDMVQFQGTAYALKLPPLEHEPEHVRTGVCHAPMSKWGHFLCALGLKAPEPLVQTHTVKRTTEAFLPFAGNFANRGRGDFQIAINPMDLVKWQ